VFLKSGRTVFTSAVSLCGTMWVDGDVLRRAGSGLGCSLGGGALDAATEA
jgi:hypothetical protein